MEDFLKDRPALSAHEVATASPSNGVPVAEIQGAFSQIRRDAVRSSPAVPTPVPNQADAQQLTGEHGTRVQTIVERGRVTKIIVTCSCGKVTEIACAY